jgi:hypothetical protein
LLSSDFERFYKVLPSPSQFPQMKLIKKAKPAKKTNQVSRQAHQDALSAALSGLLSRQAEMHPGTQGDQSQDRKPWPFDETTRFSNPIAIGLQICFGGK